MMLLIEMLFSFTAAVATIVAVVLPLYILDIFIRLFLPYGSSLRYCNKVWQLERAFGGRIGTLITYLVCLGLTTLYFTLHKLGYLTWVWPALMSAGPGFASYL